MGWARSICGATGAMTDVTILPDGIRVMARPDENLLTTLSRAGLQYRIGCRRGGCGVCKVHLVLGEVRYERPVAESVLSEQEKIEGICLSCRAVPITNVVIELQEGDKLRRVLPFLFAAMTSATGRPPDGVAPDR